jgi:uncharacterized Zn finger protein
VTGTADKAAHGGPPGGHGAPDDTGTPGRDERRSHPADEARRALRAARERGGGSTPVDGDEPTHAPAPGPTGVPLQGPSGAPPQRPSSGSVPGVSRSPASRSREAARSSEPRPPAAPAASPGPLPDDVPPDPGPGRPATARRAESRPGDAARAALRRALSARHATQQGTGHGTDAAPRPAPGPGPGPGPDPAPAPGAPSAATALPATGGRPARAAGSAPAQQPLAAGTGEDRRPGRPADIARAALRLAREEAHPQRPESGTADHGDPATGGSTTRSGRPAAGGATSSEHGPVSGAAREEPEGSGSGQAPVRDTGHGTPAAGKTAASAGHAARAVLDPAEPVAGRTAAPVEPAPREEAAPVEPAAGRAAAPAGFPAGKGEAPDLPAPSPPPHGVAPAIPSMAAPRRDGDLRRTFPAFPPRPPAGAPPEVAESWWGNAWVGALEQGALDAGRLARGRDYALKGHVDAITVTPGLVLAYVQGSRPRPYRVQLRLRTLDDTDWERFLEAAVDRPGHIAALLDKELPRTLADCGVPLLPGPRDLEPRCNCPDSGHPCKHAAALCYQTARLLDADPFVLLLLRGRGERTLLDALSQRNAAREARAAGEQEPAALPGVRASETLTATSELPPLPPPLPLPAHPGQPPVYPAVPGGPDPFALDQLAIDAAARAHTLLGTGRDPWGDLTLWQDAVRLAAARPGSGLTAATRGMYAALAAATGRTTADLARAVAAWRQGGPEGLAALEEPWDPPAGRFDRARPLLLAADLPRFRPWRNRLTHPLGHVQLRLGRDGLWYAYESEPGRDDWWPRGTPDHDPVGALTGLGRATGL